MKVLFSLRYTMYDVRVYMYIRWRSVYVCLYGAVKCLYVPLFRTLFIEIHDRKAPTTLFHSTIYFNSFARWLLRRWFISVVNLPFAGFLNLLRFHYCNLTEKTFPLFPSRWEGKKCERQIIAALDPAISVCRCTSTNALNVVKMLCVCTHFKCKRFHDPPGSYFWNTPFFAVHDKNNYTTAVTSFSTAAMALCNHWKSCWRAGERIT